MLRNRNTVLRICVRGRGVDPAMVYSSVTTVVTGALRSLTPHRKTCRRRKSAENGTQHDRDGTDTGFQNIVDDSHCQHEDGQ
jgi:hypothetical protein